MLSQSSKMELLSESKNAHSSAALMGDFYRMVNIDCFNPKTSNYEIIPPPLFKFRLIL